MRVIMTAPATVAALPGSVIECEKAQAAVLIAAGVAHAGEDVTKEEKKPAAKKKAAKKDN